MGELKGIFYLVKIRYSISPVVLIREIHVKLLTKSKANQRNFLKQKNIFVKQFTLLLRINIFKFLYIFILYLFQRIIIKEYFKRILIISNTIIWKKLY